MTTTLADGTHTEATEMKPRVIGFGELFTMHSRLSEDYNKLQTNRAALQQQLAAATRTKIAELEAGQWQPLRYDDPYFDDSPVWLDENGCVCWAGANGETERLVLYGDMRLCLWRPEGEE